MAENPVWMRFRAAARRYTLTLHVQPNAKKSEVAGLHGDALKVRVAAPAEDSRANAELIRFLGESTGIPRAAIVIRHGATSRRKIVEIEGGQELAQRLGVLGKD